MAPYDILGNVALIKFPRGMKLAEKKKYASRFLKERGAVTTVLEKTDKIKGRLRTPSTKYLAGEKTTEALYRENGAEFRLNIETCYFSPRLSSERKELASSVKKGEHVLVMFGGVGPFAVTIAKTKKAARVVSIELGKEPSKYAAINGKRNKVKVEWIQGDVRKKVPTVEGMFDRIVMARPNLEDSFLDVAFKKIKKGGLIHYYGFYNEDEVDALRELILNEAKKAGKKVKITGIHKAGNIGPYMFRWRVDVLVR